LEGPRVLPDGSVIWPVENRKPKTVKEKSVIKITESDPDKKGGGFAQKMGKKKNPSTPSSHNRREKEQPEAFF